jgi:hypothetical protein
MSEQSKLPVWVLPDAIELARLVEPKAAECGWHVALGGGVLMRGASDKDVDLILYPHKTADKSRKDPFDFVTYRLREVAGFEPADPEFRDHSEYNDTKPVFSVTFKGRRVDLIFSI